MLYEYDAFNDISYDPSKWCYDILPLNNERELQPGSLTEIWLQDILKEAKYPVDTIQIDRVFAINMEILIAVSMGSRIVMAYHYSGTKFNYPVYECPYNEGWLDVACVASKGYQAFGNAPSFSLSILTEGNQILNLEMRPDSNTFTQAYRVAINSRHQYTKLLFREPQREDGTKQPVFYLWAPKRRILQQFAVALQDGKAQSGRGGPDDLQGSANPIPSTEVKIRNPRLEGREIPVDGASLSLWIDSRKDTVLCADAGNHILFECGMKVSSSEVLCGRGEPGCSGENTQSQQAYLSSPCFPLVYRPQDYVEKERFAPSAKNILGVEQAGRPRLILLCDVGNQAVRKIWQLPDHPQAQDLANFDQINTLLRNTAEQGTTQPLLRSPCINPKALYVNPCGLLTVTTEHFAYVIASYSAVPEQNTTDSGVSGSS